MQIFAEEGGEYDKKEIAIALQTWDNYTKLTPDAAVDHLPIAWI